MRILQICMKSNMFMHFSMIEKGQNYCLMHIKSYAKSYNFGNKFQQKILK